MSIPKFQNLLADGLQSVLLYNTVMTTRTRLTTDQKMRALAYIARGDTMSQVAAHLLEDFDVTITEYGLYAIKRNHSDTIARMQETMADSAIADADALLKHSRVMIAKKMQKADRDTTTLEQLDEQYRDGDIKIEDYRRQKKGLLNLSVNELTQISKTMHDQVLKIPSDGLPPGSAGALPPGGGSTPAQLEALLLAIKAGNTVELQRLIFNPREVPKNDQLNTLQV
jgi:peroxiredoxin family protein